VYECLIHITFLRKKRNCNSGWSSRPWNRLERNNNLLIYFIS